MFVSLTRLTLLHLGNEVLVEQALCLLVQRAVDGDDVTLLEHLLEVLDALAANLLLLLLAERLVVKVQELLAVKGLETTQDALADTADSDGADDLVLKIVLLLGDGSDIPVPSLNLLMGGNKVSHQDQDGHDDVLSDGDDIAAGDFGDSDAAVGLVGGVEVDVVRADAGCDGELQLLGLGKTLSSQVAGVEAAPIC
jgi:hypothetical protein